MSEIVLDTIATQRLVEQLIFLLNAFHESEKHKRGGYESTSWRGQLGGFRRALENIVGHKATNEILELVREKVRQQLGESLGDELMSRAYPRNEHALESPLGGLGYTNQVLALVNKNPPGDRSGLGQSSTSAARYAFLIGCYILLNRVEEAQALATEAEFKKLDSPDLHFSSYLLAFLKGDARGMEKQVAWAAGRVGLENGMMSLEAASQAYFGRLKKAREFSGRAVSLADRQDEIETVASYQADGALREALFGNAAEARQFAALAIGFSNRRSVAYRVALALALAQDMLGAQRLADDLEHRFSDDAVRRLNYLPTLHAQLALSRNEGSRAIEILQAAVPYEQEYVGNTALHPVFVRGQAFLTMGQAKEAQGEFRKILDHRGLVLNSPIGALVLVGVARSYSLSADIAKAGGAYEDFLTLWKDADPDIPILIAAKAEYAKLH